MNTDQFWKIIDKIAYEQDLASAIKKKLDGLSSQEIVSFQWHLDKYFDEAYLWDLWGAAYIINEGCSEDCFTDFRYGLISRGREIYEKAVNDPDSLAENEDIFDDINNENFGYAAIATYEEKTGNDIQRNFPFRRNFKVRKWNEKDLKDLLPNLWLKFGEKPEILFQIKDLGNEYIPLFSFALVWISLNNLFTPKMRKRISGTVQLLKKRKISPEKILTVLDDTVSIVDITPRYRNFVRQIIVNDIVWGDYLRLFEIEFKVKTEKDHINVPLNWEAYDRMVKHLDGRLKSWKMIGAHN